MVDPLALVRTRILALPAVTSITGTRVYSGKLPQKPLIPAVILQLIDRVESSHLRGTAGLYAARVQVHSVASNRSQAFAMASAVDGDGTGSGLSHFRGTISGTSVALIEPGGSEREEWRGGELSEYEIMRDYIVHFAVN